MKKLFVCAVLTVFSFNSAWSASPQPLLMAAKTAPAEYSEVLKEIAEVRKNAPCDKPMRSIQRLGDKTLGVKSHVCLYGDFKKFEQIATDWKNYGDWVLNNINEKPAGGSYFIKFLSMSPSAEDKLLLKYKVDFPLMKKDRAKQFKVSSRIFKGGFVVSGEGIEDEASLMNYARAEMIAFPSTAEPDQIWVAVNGKTQLKSAFLYEALPEKILQSEAGDRIIRILENYQVQETKLSLSPK